MDAFTENTGHSRYFTTLPSFHSRPKLVSYGVPYLLLKLGYRCILIRVCEEEEGGVTVPKLSFWNFFLTVSNPWHSNFASESMVKVHILPMESMETITAMLEPRSSSLLDRLSSESPSGFMLPDASLEWVLLWDVYLKFLGGGDRWLAYEALADGFTAHGRRQDMWSTITGDQVLETLDGVALTAEVILPNLEFKPGYGYETQIQFFKNVMKDFDSEELSMFLRFSTGIGRLPASRRFPAGQKLTIRFMPDQLEHLPSAHTCFWVVDIPPYEDQKDMAKKLRLAIAAPQPFELSWWEPRRRENLDLPSVRQEEWLCDFLNFEVYWIGHRDV